MQKEGQNLYEWLSERYAMSPEEIISSRRELTKIGKDLGFSFNYTTNSRMYNTSSAHQLLYWAGETTDKQTELKMALFKAHFSKGLNVSDHEGLLKISENVGLDIVKAQSVLTDKLYETIVRKIERERQEINAVPSYLFNQQFELGGAQEPIVFEGVIKKLISANDKQHNL